MLSGSHEDFFPLTMIPSSSTSYLGYSPIGRQLVRSEDRPYIIFNVMCLNHISIDVTFGSLALTVIKGSEKAIDGQLSNSNLTSGEACWLTACHFTYTKVS